MKKIKTRSINFRATAFKLGVLIANCERANCELEMTYTQTDLTTGSFRFNTNPATFGLQSLPQSEVRLVLFGSGSNKLFATNNATGVINFTTQRGSATNIFTITGGEGLFSGATGTLTLQEVYQISLDPSIPTTGISVASGTISVRPTQIPESRTTATLIGMGVIGTAFVLCKHKKYLSRIRNPAI